MRALLLLAGLLVALPLDAAPCRVRAAGPGLADVQLAGRSGALRVRFEGLQWSVATADVMPPPDGVTTEGGAAGAGGAPDAARAIVCHPSGREDVWLFALTATYLSPDADDASARDGRLWALELGAASAVGSPLEARLVRAEPGADFAQGALCPLDGSWTYSGPRGLSLLELESGSSRVLTAAPERSSPRCLARPPVVDIAPRWSADGTRLFFTRGGYCGYKGDFEGRRVAMDLTTQGVLEPRPVTTLAIGPDGAVYWGDGGACQLPGLRTPSTPGTIFRSDDGGDSYERLGLSAGDGAPLVDAAVRTVLVDRDDPNVIVVMTAACRDGARGPWGGDLYRSEDGGEGWRRFGPPPLMARWDSAGQGMGLTVLRSGGGSLDRLLASDGDTGWVAAPGPDGELTWRPWRGAPVNGRRASADAVPPEKLGVEHVYEVRVHPDTASLLFAATSGGLFRSRDAGATWSRVGLVERGPELAE